MDSARDLSIEWYIDRRIEDELDEFNDFLETDEVLPLEAYYD